MRLRSIDGKTRLFCLLLVCALSYCGASAEENAVAPVPEKAEPTTKAEEKNEPTPAAETTGEPTAAEAETAAHPPPKNDPLTPKILVLTQEYTLVEMDKDGLHPKAVKQIMYVTPGKVQVDEYKTGGETPVETLVLDLDRELIFNFDHVRKEMTGETFAERRKRIEDREKSVKEDLAAMREGPQKDSVRRLYKHMLDEDRKYKAETAGEPEEIAGVQCEVITVGDIRDREYRPLRMSVHPELNLPYDSEESLYLLRLISRRMADFLRTNKALLRRLPMKLNLNVAAGGTLDVLVKDVRRMTEDELRPDFSKRNRTLFEPPVGYKDIGRKMTTTPRKAERPD